MQLGALVATITTAVQFVVIYLAVSINRDLIGQLYEVESTVPLAIGDSFEYLGGLLAVSGPAVIVSFATTGIFLWVIRHHEKPDWPIRRWLSLSALWLALLIVPLILLWLVGSTFGVSDQRGQLFATVALVSGAWYVIWFSVRTTFAQYLITEQAYTPRAALRVSATLTRGRWGRTLLQLFFMNLLAAGAASLLLLMMPTNEFPTTGSLASYFFIEGASTWLTTLLSAPIVAIGVGMLYLDLMGEQTNE
jgi:hypothetical protein